MARCMWIEEYIELLVDSTCSHMDSYYMGFINWTEGQ